MLDVERAQVLAQEALRLSPADQTEVVVEALGQELNRFTHEHPVQNVVRLAATVSVRVRVDGREGKASTGTLDQTGLARVVDRALTAARHAPAEEHVPLPGPAQVSARAEEPLEPDPEGTARKVAQITEACRASGGRAAGVLEAASTLRLVTNSNGLCVSGFDNRAELGLSVFNGQAAGWAGDIAPGREGLDVPGVSARAIEKARAGVDPVTADPGHYTVVLEPAAVSSLLLFTAARGFGAQQVEEGSSFLSGQLGQPVLGNNVTIVDDAHDDRSIGHVFDGEGVPRQRVVLIDGGVARGVVHDSASAERAGCASTGHARSQPSASGPVPTNLVMSGGDGSVEDLVAGTDRGILVTAFHYANVVEPTRLTLTGMTRYGTFLIEKGQLTRPVRNLRFTQSLVDAFGRITGLGSKSRLCSAMFGGYVIVPPLRIEGFSFSSGTGF